MFTTITNIINEDHYRVLLGLVELNDDDAAEFQCHLDVAHAEPALVTIIIQGYDSTERYDIFFQAELGNVVQTSALKGGKQVDFEDPDIAAMAIAVTQIPEVDIYLSGRNAFKSKTLH